VNNVTQVIIALSLYALFLIGATVFVLWNIGQILDDHLNAKRKRKLKTDLMLALQHRKLTWEEVKILAEANFVKSQDLRSVVLGVTRETLTSSDDGNESIPLLRSFIINQEIEEPFEGLPEDVRVHFERFRDHLSGETQILEPIVSYIKNLAVKNKREKLWQNWVAIIGAITGILGLVIPFLIAK
jgi:hypothetical protein